MRPSSGHSRVPVNLARTHTVCESATNSEISKKFPPNPPWFAARVSRVVHISPSGEISREAIAPIFEAVY